MEGMKPILDACCGGRMFWFDKENPHVLFCDNRTFDGKANDGRNFQVQPDILCDFTQLPFADKSDRASKTHWMCFVKINEKER